LQQLKTILTIGICLVWLINGLYCKVLHQVPRHELIVARIIGAEHAPILTRVIGVSEMLIVFLIISGMKSRWCALLQIFLVAIMNIIEFIIVPDLLLFGRFNFIVATIFIITVYVNEFALKKEIANVS
jgi:hypothetical protein